MAEPQALPEKAFPVSWDQFHRDARALAWRLAASGPFTAIVAITRGGLIPAALLSYRGRLHSLMVAVEQPPSDLDELFAKPTFAQFPADPLIKGKRILVVDSVWSTARSMTAVKARVEQAGGQADLCVLHYRTEDAWGGVKPTYVAEEIGAWLVYPWEPPEETGIEESAGVS